jgi:DNA-binding MarR family transcriptional regulator
MTNSQSSFKDVQPPANELLHLLFKANHFLHQQFEVELVTQGLPEQLTGQRLRVLLEISAVDTIRMNELAIKLGIKARTVTQFVDALEKDNFILRIPDTSDRRATLLQLTDSAKTLMEKAEAVMSSASDKVMSSLSSEQRKLLFDILLMLMKRPR